MKVSLIYFLIKFLFRSRTFAPAVFIFVACSVCAQNNFRLEKVQGEGLTNYYIKCIQQDKNGFLWFGTEEGLFRYDGYNFLAFKNFPGDPGTICNNNIEFLYPESDGSVWIGSRGGLSSVKNLNAVVANYPAPKLFTVYAIVPKDSTHFFIGTSAGLYVFDKSSSSWHLAPGFPENAFIRSLCSDGQGNLYVTTHDGLYKYSIRGKSCSHTQLPLTPGQKNTYQIAHKSLLDKNGILWVTTWNAGLVRFDTQTGKATTVLADAPDKEFGHYISSYDLLQNTDGTIWIANSENGITLLNPSRKNYTRYPLKWDDLKEIPNRVYSLFRDKNGITWIGTENGIYKNDPYSPQPATIGFLPEKNAKPQRADLSPICMLIDKNGLWWMGMYEGLFLLDPATGVLKDYSSQINIPAHTIVTNLLEDSTGDLWLAAGHKLVRVSKTWQHKLMHLHATSFGDPGIQSVITGLLIDHQKRIWIGTHSSGLYRFSSASSQFIPYPCSDTTINIKNEIRSFFEQSDGSILIAGEHMGLLKLYPQTGRYERIEQFDKIAGGDLFPINTIVKDDQHHLWIPTEGNGFFESDEFFQKIKHYTFRDGFPSMNIIALLPLSNDHLWLLSEGGIIDFGPSADKLTVFDKGAGIRNFSSTFSMMKDKEDHVVIGDMGCIHIFDQFALPANHTMPNVIITGFKIFDTPYSSTNQKPIQLKYNQNYFSFDFVALNYTEPTHTTYTYMLEGLDDKWHDAGTRRYVSYANLKEGSYTFKVRACNNEGMCSKQPAVLHFVILPPFWHRWWFYGLLILFVMFAVYLVDWIKKKQFKSKEQLRNKIARDLHDDIGSTLSGINIFSKIALGKVHSDQNASSELLQKINERSAKTMEALSDIVWSINTRNDSMNNVLAKMREYLGEVLEPAGIQFEFIVDKAINHMHVNMEMRKEVYLIFKEAVNNATKYATCNFMQVQVFKGFKSVILIIQDNGRGFDVNTVIPGNGIYNMKERALRMKADFIIQSEINKGTFIRLVLPITRNR